MMIIMVRMMIIVMRMRMIIDYVGDNIDNFESERVKKE